MNVSGAIGNRATLRFQQKLIFSVIEIKLPPFSLPSPSLSTAGDQEMCVAMLSEQMGQHHIKMCCIGSAQGPCVHKIEGQRPVSTSHHFNHYLYFKNCHSPQKIVFLSLCVSSHTSFKMCCMLL